MIRTKPPALAAMLAATIALAACAGGARPAADAPPPDWRRVATEADRVRLRGWRTAFLAAREAAQARGFAAQLAAEGALLDPDAGQPAGRPPEGLYRCRFLKLGARGAAGPGFVVQPISDCRVTARGALARLRKLGGAQRPVGVIYDGEAGTARAVFLGTLALGDERRAIRYGLDPDRDMVGAFERLADGRWRLLLPSPRFDSLFDVIELVPAER